MTDTPPHVLLCDWTVYETDCGSRHFVGRDPRRHYRVSGAIVRFDAGSRTGIDQDGQAWALSGGNGGGSTPGAWQGWCERNDVKGFRELTADYCSWSASVYVDTEFTGFIDCDLISIGLVAADGREFYGERSDYDRAACSEFVHAAVLPQLGQHPGRVFTREALRVALAAWLDGFAPQPRRLCFDHSIDWELLCDLLDGPPADWLACRVEPDLARIEGYHREHGGRHHALIDARARRAAASVSEPAALPG